MLIFYVDESGNSTMGANPKATQLKKGATPYLVMSAVGIHDTSRKLLAEEIMNLKTKVFVSHPEAGWEDTEVKGRFLAQHAKGVKPGSQLGAPKGYLRLHPEKGLQQLVVGLGNIITTFQPTIFTVVIDKAEQMKVDRTANPVGLAYAYLNQRVAKTLDKVVEGQSAMFIADQQTEHEAYFRSGEMNAVRDEQKNAKRHNIDYRRVLDMPLWVDTKLSTWDREIIQLADIVTYATLECMKNGAEPKEAHFLWKQIRPCLATTWGNGAIPDGSFVIRPKPKAYPLAST